VPNDRSAELVYTFERYSENLDLGESHNGIEKKRSGFGGGASSSHGGKENAHV